MRVYGYGDIDIVRGEIHAAEIDKADMDYPEQLAARLDWVMVSTRFSDAKAKLIAAMQAEGSDKELIDVVYQIKASYVQP